MEEWNSGGASSFYLLSFLVDYIDVALCFRENYEKMDGVPLSGYESTLVVHTKKDS